MSTTSSGKIFSNFDETLGAADTLTLQAMLVPPPSLATFEACCQASASAANPPSGLTLMHDPSGRALNISTASGVNASAFLDQSGNVIISYQYTTSNSQLALDTQILSGAPPSTVAGYNDALAFAKQVQSAAVAEGHLLSSVYVTGFSLGGTLSSYVASQTGLAGAAFAASGIPGYEAPVTAAANFVNFIDKGDPFANYGTDAAENGSARVSNAHFDHYGTVVQIGSASDAADLASFAKAISGYGILSIESGQTPMPLPQVFTLANQFYALLGEHHSIAALAPTAAIPASSFALTGTNEATIMGLIQQDLPRLQDAMPSLLASPNYARAFQGFAQEFPDLAGEVTELVHAPTFAAAMDVIMTESPSLLADFTDPAKLATLITTSYSKVAIPQHTSAVAVTTGAAVRVESHGVGAIFAHPWQHGMPF